MIDDQLHNKFWDLLPGFGAWLLEKGYEANTIKDYTGKMRRNATYHLIQIAMTADEAKGPAVEAFIRYRKERA